MPYRRPGGSRTSVSTAPVSRMGHSNKSYTPQSSGAKRHEVTLGVASNLTLATGEYIILPLLQFRRSATGGTNDVPLAPTLGSNFQNNLVMNGSYVSNFKSTIRIKNRGAISGYLDLYEVQMSFFDVLIWNTLLPANCPLTFDNTTVGPADLRGGVANKAMTTTLISENNINNRKFLQHYIKKRGSLFISNEDGGNGGELTININKVPAKCRRSQTGMYWGIYLHNNSDKNGGESLNLDVTNQLSFLEHPTDNRLIFLD